MKPHEEFIKELKEKFWSNPILNNLYEEIYDKWIAIGYDEYNAGNTAQTFIDEINSELKQFYELAEKHFNSHQSGSRRLYKHAIGNPKQEMKSFSLNCHKSKDSVDSPVEDLNEVLNNLDKLVFSEKCEWCIKNNEPIIKKILEKHKFFSLTTRKEEDLTKEVDDLIDKYYDECEDIFLDDTGEFELMCGKNKNTCSTCLNNLEEAKALKEKIINKATDCCGFHWDIKDYCISCQERAKLVNKLNEVLGDSESQGGTN